MINTSFVYRKSFKKGYKIIEVFLHKATDIEAFQQK